jgi:hypothetical protein
MQVDNLDGFSGVSMFQLDLHKSCFQDLPRIRSKGTSGNFDLANLGQMAVSGMQN